MSITLKQEWRALKKGRAGHRFEDRYHAGRRDRRNAKWSDQIGRIVRLVTALVVFAIGVVLVFIPGPAILFFFLAGGLLAAESRLIARFLDWSELRLRALIAWLKRRWQAMPQWGKVLALVVAACVAGAGGFLVFRVVT